MLSIRAHSWLREPDSTGAWEDCGLWRATPPHLIRSFIKALWFIHYATTDVLLECVEEFHHPTQLLHHRLPHILNRYAYLPREWVVEIERHNDYKVILIPRCPVSSCNTWRRLPIAQKIFHGTISWVLSIWVYKAWKFFMVSSLSCPSVSLDLSGNARHQNPDVEWTGSSYGFPSVLPFSKIQVGKRSFEKNNGFYFMVGNLFFPFLPLFLSPARVPYFLVSWCDKKYRDKRNLREEGVL